jgi:hypothetical protein
MGLTGPTLTHFNSSFLSIQLIFSSAFSLEGKPALRMSLLLYPLQLSGCQVACRFYEKLGEKGEGPPSVSARRENVLQISDGKIQWPRRPNQPHLTLSTDNLVFLVIQQYPDRKWRQITQVR